MMHFDRSWQAVRCRIHLLMQSWSKAGVDHFAMMDFEADISEVLGAASGALVPFQKALLKWAWAKCQQRRETPSPLMEPATASTDNPSSTWTESFAPKLTSGVVAALKSSFRKSYPAEILTAENTPSNRLLSMVHHQGPQMGPMEI